MRYNSLHHNDILRTTPARTGGKSVKPIERILGTIAWVLAIVLTLSGCVKYESEINFASLNGGEIVQHIHLDPQVNKLGQTAVTEWIKSIESRTHQLAGVVNHPHEDELEIKIPFNNAKDLERKFNQYFVSNSSQDGIKSHLQVSQNNFLLFVRTHLIYDLDLRSILTTTDRKISIPPESLLDLNFQLNSPWGMTRTSDVGLVTDSSNSNPDRTVNWHLQPNQINQVDAVFWLPNYLAIGTIPIVLLGLGGYYLKYRSS
jgi:hypothetical protein